MDLDNEYESWIHNIPVYQKCPHCVNGRLDTRIKRGFIVKNFFVWMNVKRYQCNSCRKKVYIKNCPEHHQLDF